MLENSNDKSLMLSLNANLAYSLVVPKAVFNLIIIDVYADGTEDLWRPQFSSGDFVFDELSLNDTTFSRSKMEEIHGKRINLIQYDEPPFSYVKNRKLIGVEGKFLDLLCEQYNLTYRIINENTEQFVYKDTIRKFINKEADLSLATIVQMPSKVCIPKDFDHNLAYVTTCQYAEAFIRSARNFNGNQRLFDLMDEKITFYAQSYPVSNIFPLKKELQLFVSVLRESGLRDYWVQSEVHENNRDIKEDEKSVLSLNDMQLPFIILGSGLGLSLLVFIFELIVNNIKERRMNRVIYL
ncbi:unnamed protein product [Diamesa tonsa]